MPKNNKTSKHDGKLFKQKVQSTLSIGSRKGGTSAHTMSTDALLAVLSNKSHTKSHSNARTVLKLRGVSM